MTVDNYMTDLLVRICARKGARLLTFVAGPVDNTILLTSYGEFNRVRDPADVEIAVRWVLARPELFLNTVGDVKLLPHVLAAADKFDGEAPPADEVEALVERRSLTPLFV